MKKFTVVALIIMLPLMSLAQSRQEDSSYTPVTPKNIAFATPNKDTLYLLKSEIGSRIASLWNKDSYDAEKNGQKPTIIFVDHFALDKLASVTKK